jgi:hypothetical protein
VNVKQFSELKPGDRFRLVKVVCRTLAVLRWVFHNCASNSYPRGKFNRSLQYVPTRRCLICQREWADGDIIH